MLSPALGSCVRTLVGLLVAQTVVFSQVGVTTPPKHTIRLMEDPPGGTDGLRARAIGEFEGALKISVAPLGGHVLVLTEDGHVWAWGDNSFGQLGVADANVDGAWRLVAGLDGVVAIATGAQHSVALTRDGTVWTWGANAMGQLGDGTLVAHPKPAAVPHLRQIMAIAADALSTAVLREDGAVFAFGSNWGGIAPRDTRKMVTEPVEVARLEGTREICIRNAKVLPGITGDHLWPSRRDPNRKVLAAPTTIQIFEADHEPYIHQVNGTVIDSSAGWALGWIEAPIAASPSPAASEADARGEVQDLPIPSAASSASDLTATAPGPGWIAASSGGSHTLRLNADGTVGAFGANAFGQLGDGTFVESSKQVQVMDLRGIVAVAAGSDYSMALAADGRVWEWGVGADGITRSRPTQVAGLASVVALAAGRGHRIALKGDGTVWTWGRYNWFGEIGDGSKLARPTPVQVMGLSGVTAISAGYFHSLAVKGDGSVLSWGAAREVQSEGGMTTERLVPVQIEGLVGAISIAAGGYHSLAALRDGTVWAWGSNVKGQLGDGTTVERATPVRVTGLAGVALVGAGEDHSLAVKTDGTVWAWGRNGWGQLGDGTAVDRYSPVEVSGLRGVASIAGGESHSMAVQADGTLWTWGNNSQGQLGDGTTTSRSMATVTTKPPQSVKLPKPGVFRMGFYWLLDVDGNRQFESPSDRAFAFGGFEGDVPITGDWNGDGRDKAGIYRPRNGLFILDNDGDGQFSAMDAVYDLGVGVQPGDVPVVGDWNGDGRSKVGLFRQGYFWILDYDGDGMFKAGTDKTHAFGGMAGDVPVVGDWAGTGTSKIGLVRQGFYWILDANGSGSFEGTGAAQDVAFPYGGIPGDVPVVGDWNGDGRSKPGVFRQGFFWVLDANGNYQFDGTGDGKDLAFPFGGIVGDRPLVGKW